MIPARAPRAALTLIAVAALFVAAGCGGTDTGAPETTAPETTAPPPEATAPPPATTTEQETVPGETTAPPPAPAVTTVNVVVQGGVPQGGIVRATVKKGARVRLVVRSDVADEIHLHGYDVSKDVASGGTTRISFVASVPGRFEVELEQRGVQLADLTVRP